MAIKDLTRKGQESRDKPKGFDDFDLKLGDMLRGERATLGKSLLDVQRELRISAQYIAAIENSDPDAFDTPGFIAGYVRSYARYLGLEPDAVFEQFCQESGFYTAHGMSTKALPKREQKSTFSAAAGTADFDDAIFAKSPSAILAPKSGFFERLEAGALGSIAVLALLVSGLGYGAWSVFKEIQQVTVTPVDTTPVVLTEFDTPNSQIADDGSDQVTGVSQQQRRDLLDRMYRPAALDVPILVSRDAPISTLDPNRFGSFTDQIDQAEVAAPAGIEDILSQVLAENTDTAPLNTLPIPQVVESPRPELAVIATREAWVQIKSPNGATLFEKVMKPGEEFILPQTENAPVMRAGMSGSVYFAVNGDLYGPAGTGGNVAKNVELSVASLTDSYLPADPAQDGQLNRMLAELEFESLNPIQLPQ